MKIIAKIDKFEFHGDCCEVPYTAYNQAMGIVNHPIYDTKLKAYIGNSHKEVLEKLKKQADEYISSRVTLKCLDKYISKFCFKYVYLEIDEDGGIAVELSPQSVRVKDERIFIETKK
jgi:hypothetical protein